MPDPEPFHVLHLISSGFYGGPERQIVGLANALAPGVRTTIGTFSDGGKGAALRAAADANGHASFELASDTPRFDRMAADLRRELGARRPNLLITHHYKADATGAVASRLAGVPCWSVSHGWTAESPSVKRYERLDRFLLRTMQRVICVSHEQERRVRAAGVSPARTRTIWNAVDTHSFDEAQPAGRERLIARFPAPPARVIGAIGRLSPEKGFVHLIDAAARLAPADPGLGWIVFGEGPERGALEARIRELDLGGRVVLAGFEPDIRDMLCALDLVVSSSLTEGLPVVLLEAMAARVPVVATAVGGTPEVVRDGVTGRLVPVSDPEALAVVVAALIADEPLRRSMGAAGRARVEAEFTFAAQSSAYRQLFAELAPA